MVKISLRNLKLLESHKQKHIKNKTFKNKQQLNKHMKIMKLGLARGLSFNKAHDLANKTQEFKATKPFNNKNY